MALSSDEGGDEEHVADWIERTGMSVNGDPESGGHSPSPLASSPEVTIEDSLLRHP